MKFKGRLYFKQYMKSKPTQWGIKVWCSADPSTGHLLDFSVHIGKAQQPTKGVYSFTYNIYSTYFILYSTYFKILCANCKVYVQMCVSIGVCVLLAGGLGHHVANCLDKGHHFYHDNFFTSIELAKSLLDTKTCSCGTICMNRKGWPAELKISKNTKENRLKVGEVKMMQQGDLVAPVWQDKRTIAVLSTNIQPVMGSALRQTGRGESELSFNNGHFLYCRSTHLLDNILEI